MQGVRGGGPAVGAPGPGRRHPPPPGAVRAHHRHLLGGRHPAVPGCYGGAQKHGLMETRSEGAELCLPLCFVVQLSEGKVNQ